LVIFLGDRRSSYRNNSFDPFWGDRRSSYPNNSYNPFNQFYRRLQPQTYESIKPPAPRKVETSPSETVVVVGDSFGDWLGYGLEFTHRFDLHGVLDRHQHPRANQDLPRSLASSQSREATLDTVPMAA
jgi:hypothetical protein